jgi:hypothetical protein
VCDVFCYEQRPALAPAQYRQRINEISGECTMNVLVVLIVLLLLFGGGGFYLGGPAVGGGLGGLILLVLLVLLFTGRLGRA